MGGAEAWPRPGDSFAYFLRRVMPNSGNPLCWLRRNYPPFLVVLLALVLIYKLAGIGFAIAFAPGGPIPSFPAEQNSVEVGSEYVVIFHSSADRTEQRHILAAFPEVTYLRDGFFPALAVVGVAGPVEDHAARLRQHEEVKLVVDLEGFAVCH